MSYKSRRLSEALGVEIRCLDLRSIDAKTSRSLYQDFVDAGVMCVREQDLSPAEFLNFAHGFGEPIVQIYGQFNLPGFAQIGLLTSEDADSAGSGQRKIRGTSWHTDASYFERPPKATMLHAQLVPQTGGDTDFLSTAAAYAAAPEALKSRADGAVATHNYQSSRSPRQLIKRSTDQVDRFSEGTRHPLVRVCPDTGAKALYLNPIRIECIDGLPRADSDTLLDELLAHCLQPQFRYRHQWQLGDVVIWDNRSVLHQANDDYDFRVERRRLIRIMLEGEVPV